MAPVIIFPRLTAIEIAAYYANAAAIIARHPCRVLGHPEFVMIVRDVLRRDFRLHWLRDVAAGN